MIGIYKITNPHNKVYIGQSVNIEKRFKKYKGMHCIGQNKILRSLNKYGVDNHLFEVIEECEIFELNNKERYYQEIYDVLSVNGLNLKYTQSEDRSGVLSLEVRNKISKSNLGKITNVNSINAMIKANTGKVRSKETKLKISLANKGRKLSQKHIEILKNRVVKPTTDECKLKISNSLKGIIRSKESIILMLKNRKTLVKVIDISTNIIYESVAEAARHLNVKAGTLNAKLHGRNPNNTNFKIYNNE